MSKSETIMSSIQTRFKTIVSPIKVDTEKHLTESPVVSGQALTGSEIFRRMSSGLPIGCAVRSFNEIDPRIEKFSVYDSLGQFRIRHGLVDSTELETSPDFSSSNPPAQQEEVTE